MLKMQENDDYCLVVKGEQLPAFCDRSALIQVKEILGIKLDCTSTLRSEGQVIKAGLSLESALRFKERLGEVGVSIQIKKKEETQKRSESSVLDGEKTPVHTENVWMMILAGILASLVGAMAWKAIASMTGYELVFAAWGLGALVGYAVSLFSEGSSKTSVGVMCGILAFVAILFGKYWVVSDFHKNTLTILKTHKSVEALRSHYEKERHLARVFLHANLQGNALKKFILVNGYTYALDTQGVTENEVMLFKVHTVMRFKALEYENIEYPQWVEMHRRASQHINPFQLIVFNTTWVDFLFLFLGLSTAFQIGKGSRIRVFDWPLQAIRQRNKNE